MAANLILINGIPGSGKTTLARKLQKDLGLPLLRKDFLKEALFDELGMRDQPWSKLLGRIVSEWLYTAIEDFQLRDEPLIVENAFIHEFAAPTIREVVSRHHANCIELYCQLDPDELVRRFNARITNGTRHKGHGDVDMVYSEELREYYAPLEAGTTIYVDTTHFSEAEYQQLLTNVKGELHA